MMRLYFIIVEEDQKSQLFWIILPLAVCVLIMLPRLLSPQFGMLDDGNTLTTASRIVAGDLSLNYEADRGRFRPMYWLVPALVYSLAGAHPLWFYIANLIILVFLIVFASAFLRQLGVPAKKTALIGMLFILSGSTVENVYTLSKGELLMLLFIVIALYNSAKLNKEDVSVKTLIMRTLVSTILLFFADINKETALVVVPIVAGWLMIEFVGARLRHRPPHGRWLVSLFASCLISFVIYWLIRNSLVATTLQGGTYTSGYSFTIAAMKASLIRWIGWLLRNDFYLLPLILFWVIASLVNKNAQRAEEVFSLLLWMMGWIAVYIPWRFAQEYYLLPFDLGAAIFTVLLASQVLSTLRESPRIMKLVAGAALIFAAMLWLVTLPNYWTDARIQLAVDSANQQMLDAMEKLPENSSVLLNIQYPNEYTVELGLLLHDVRGRADIQIKTFNPSNPQPADYLLTPYIENRPLLTVRMGVSEKELTSWVSSLQDYVGASTQPVMRVEQSLHLLVVDLPRIFCPLIPRLNFCAVPRPLVDTRTFIYGWMLYTGKP